MQTFRRGDRRTRECEAREGPRWDAATRRLLWVDIEGCELHVLESREDRAVGRGRRRAHQLTLSNGLGWTRDDTRMYYIDSAVYRVDVFDFELASGRLDERRPFVSIDKSDGIPDGLTVDDEGGVWVALYGGSCVHRYDERGRLDAVLEVPAENVTSCCFGGDDGRSLFVTTAAPERNVYVTQPGVSGPPAHVFHPGGTRTAPSEAEDTSAR
jgi:sugar lactone lactonase YvrE